VLRAKVAAELVAHREWYLAHVFHSSVSEYEDSLHRARTDAMWSPTEHLAALANVLLRPIALLASLADMSGVDAYLFNTGTYLPARHPPAHCCPYPLLLAWSSRVRNHFVPLCRLREDASPALPELCRPKTCFPGGTSVEAYIRPGFWCLSPTRLEELPARSVARPENAELFETRLLARGVGLAEQALRALPAAAAVHLLTHEGGEGDTFRARAAAAGPGALAASAVVLHAAEREATELRTRRQLRTGVDGVWAAAYNSLAAALPAPHTVALRCAVIAEAAKMLQNTRAEASSDPLLAIINALTYRDSLEATWRELNDEHALLMDTLPALVEAHEQATAAATAEAAAASAAPAAVEAPAALTAAPASAHEAAAPSGARKRKAEGALARQPSLKRDGRATLERLLALQHRAPRWVPVPRDDLTACVHACRCACASVKLAALGLCSACDVC
jgi:hypothetical protein